MAGLDDSGSHPRPMLTVDVVVLADGALSQRVLLVQRGTPPFRGSWALPGGFVEEGERIVEAAPRELAEETGLQLDSGRDPRGWTVSVVYLARVRAEASVTGADDASDARWFAAESLPDLAFDHAMIIADALAAA
jgi:8-oxo-dGTP diphosphatase